MQQFLDADRPVWEVRDDETSVWYDRFQAFLLEGPNRSIQSAAKRLGLNADPAWYQEARSRKWRERAIAYDNDLAKQRRIEVEGWRWNQRKMRVNLIDELMETLKDALNSLDVEDLTWRGFIELFKVVVSASQTEFESSKLELSGPDGGPIQAQIDSEMQDARERFTNLLVTIAERTRDTATN